MTRQSSDIHVEKSAVYAVIQLSLYRAFYIFRVFIHHSNLQIFLIKHVAAIRPIVHNIQRIAKYCPKNANFMNPRLFNAPARGVFFATVEQRMSSKIEWWVYLAEKTFDDVFGRLDTKHECDR